MSTHNIRFRREIRKLFTLYPLLSRPMQKEISFMQYAERKMTSLGSGGIWSEPSLFCMDSVKFKYCMIKQ